MLPEKTLNIYPKTDSNIQALIQFYFDDHNVEQSEGLNLIKTYTNLSLNQIEYILQKLSESYETIFRKELKGKIRLTNLFKYAISALVEPENIKKSGSPSRIAITKAFQEFVIKTNII